MRLYMHITSQSFVQSYRRFERNSYVHTSSTSDTAGIGFPHHYSHESTGVGLVNITSLLEEIGGTCQVEENDAFYRIALTWPWQAD